VTQREVTPIPPPESTGSRPSRSEAAGAADSTADPAVHQSDDSGWSGPLPPDPAAPSRPDAAACHQRSGVEIRIGLGTLLGLDDHPAELAGWGPITAEHARDVVARHRLAEWRFAVVNEHGYLIVGGLIRARPGSTGPPGTDGRRGGVVEIHVRAGLLHDLARCPDLPPGWAPAVADIARQHADRRRMLAELDRRPLARFPSAGLRRHIQMRDRTCVAPGCRRPAAKAEQDHTRDHARGGRTVQGNVGPLCRRHHWMKHNGWLLTQPEPGLFRWRSPLGQVYRTRGEPIMLDLPDAVPDPDLGAEPPDEQPRHVGGAIFDARSRLRKPSAAPPPAADPPDGPPF
jgi:hypothetical protein